MKKLLFLCALSGAFLYACVVPPPTDSNSIEITGIVTSVFESGEKDIVFKIIGEEPGYYINRGLQHDLDVEKLNEELMGKKVHVVYADMPFDPEVKHLYFLRQDDQIIFREHPGYTPASLR